MMHSIKQSSHLQSIPEHESHGNPRSLAAQDASLYDYPPPPPSQSNSSTRGVRDDRPAASVVSDTPALLADRASTSSQDSKPSAARRRRRLWSIVGFSIVLTVLVVVSIVLIVLLGPDDRSSNSSSNTTNNADDGSNSSGTLAPSTDSVPDATTEMTRQVDEVLVTISSPSDLADPSTPQYKARNWLLTEDLLLQDVLWEGSDRLAQRYIAELFYWSLAPAHATSYLWPDASECDWQGLSCPEQERGHVLTGIMASDQNLTGSLPRELYYLSTLQQLDISKNKITGSIPSEFFDSWTELYMLDVSQNGLTGELPASLWALPDLRYLYLNQNNFGGIIDDSSLTDQSALVDVWIHENDLTGTLPVLFFQAASELQTWSAYDNRIFGSLPSNVGARNLTFFDVSYNELNGTLDNLADGLLRYQTLETLYVDNNKLRGTLPSNLDTAAPLKQFWLHRNKIEGSIPSDFGLLWTQLRELRLHRNDLRGNITDRCSSWPLLEKLEADCRVKNNGQVNIECDCCTDCE